VKIDQEWTEHFDQGIQLGSKIVTKKEKSEGGKYWGGLGATIPSKQKSAADRIRDGAGRRKKL